MRSAITPGVKSIAAVNDFVVKFANVNGSGSASANELFAKAILRMGVPVSPRNIFPSNIQGLPTWYEVRVTEKGYLGRRGGVDMMVAMNPQTWDKDIAEIEPGGYLLYDSTKALPASKFRDDINIIGVPLTEICNETYSDPRERQLFKNIIYVGVLSALLDMDAEAIAELIGEQYKTKEKLLKHNVHALQLGRDYARARLACPLGIRIAKRDNIGDMILVEGNAAAALGMVYGGATVCAWYPITPSSSVAEAFINYCQKLRLDTTNKSKYAFDFPKSLGANVRAARGGIVTKAKESSSQSCWNGSACANCTGSASGNVVKILHQDGTEGVYVHFRQNGVLVSEGQRVYRGDLIGKVGTTGCSTGPHLHFHVVEETGSGVTVPVKFETYDDDDVLRNCHVPPHNSNGTSTNP